MGQPVKTEMSYAGLFAKKDILLTSIISLSYLLISRILIGYKPEQVVLVLLFNVLFIFHLLPGSLLPAFQFLLFFG